jgi:hypothetical protein
VFISVFVLLDRRGQGVQGFVFPIPSVDDSCDVVETGFDDWPFRRCVQVFIVVFVADRNNGIPSWLFSTGAMQNISTAPSPKLEYNILQLAGYKTARLLTQAPQLVRR